MRNLERLTVETGRVIHKRYLLQRLVKQGQTCTVYQGFDQVLQRVVAVKVTAAEHVAAYRAAIKATSQFAHPNIIGIYDLIIEPDVLYIVQEYVDGDDFGTLLQAQLSLYEVVEFGMQLCQALMYASTPSRKVCHGDLSPSSVIRDRRGFTRVNNFALPGDVAYFSGWDAVGGNGTVFADSELPAGQMSDGRRADDTRAVGLLLYQLLAGRPPEARTVDPPPDGRLHFTRSAPPELCEIIARTVMVQHPQYIKTADVLHAELKVLAEALEPVAPPMEEVARVSQFSPIGGANALSQPLAQGGFSSADTAPVGGAPAATAMARSYTTGHLADVNVLNAPGRLNTASLQDGYPQPYPVPELSPRGINMPLLLLIGLVLFVLFFGIGYYLSTVLIK